MPASNKEVYYHVSAESYGKSEEQKRAMQLALIRSCEWSSREWDLTV